jgi:hypothetical protein
MPALPLAGHQRKFALLPVGRHPEGLARFDTGPDTDYPSSIRSRSRIFRTPFSLSVRRADRKINGRPARFAISSARFLTENFSTKALKLLKGTR